MSIGVLVSNQSQDMRAKLFSKPLGPHALNRGEVGFLDGVGLVLDVSGSDFLVTCTGGTGWVWAGNVKRVML